MENSNIPYSTLAIAKKIGVSKSTVSNYRKALRKEGLIEEKRRVSTGGGDWMVSRELFDEIPCNCRGNGIWDASNPLLIDPVTGENGMAEEFIDENNNSVSQTEIRIPSRFSHHTGGNP